MPSRFKPAKPRILLPCIIICASCALSQTCIQCSLTCDETPELKKHGRILVFVEHLSKNVYEKEHTVSSLCDGECCSVPGCFQKDTFYALKIYALDNEQVPKVLVNKTSVQPDCGPERISGGRTTAKHPIDGAAGNLCNTLLILLAFLFFHLLLP